MGPDIVPSPLILQTNDVPLEVTVCTFPVELLQTAEGPLTEQVGEALIGVASLQVDVQPLAFVTVTKRVYEPVAPAVTDTEEPLVRLVIVPDPDIDQL